MDDPHEKPRPEPPREVTPRDDVHVAGSPVRCPFCHTDVAIDDEWSACSRCLARHHPPCWSEGGRCASCGHDGAVRHERAAKKVHVEARTSSGKAIFAALLLGVIGLAVIVFLGYLRAASGQNEAMEAFRAEQHARAAQQVRGEPQTRRPATTEGRRYEKDGALVVEDGRGSFVAVFAAESSIVFGLNVVLVGVDAETITVLQGQEMAHARRTMKPLIVHEANETGSYWTDLATPRMTTADLAALLRATHPSELDLAALVKRVMAGE